MRINLYTEEFEHARIEIVRKRSETGRVYRGLRIYITTPVMQQQGDNTVTVRGPWHHGPGDDDTSAVTFWGLNVTEETLRRALSLVRSAINNDQVYGDECETVDPRTKPL